MGRSGTNRPSNIEDPVVYEALKDYFSGMLKPDIIDRVPLERKRKFRKEKFTYIRPYDTIQPNQRALRRLVFPFEEFDGFEQVTDALGQCDFYEIDRPEGIAYEYTIREFFSNMISRSSEVGMFEKDTFDNVYEDFERFHLSDTIPSRVWTYLFGFEMSEEEIDIDSRFTIREMSVEEREELNEKLHDSARSWPMRRRDVYQQYILEYRFEQPNTPTYNFQREYSELERLLTGIRVFQPDGTVNTGHHFVEPLWNYVEGNRGTSRITRRKYGGNEYCDLSPTECSQFPKFFKKVEHLITTKSKKSFTSPLTRLNESHQKYSSEDRVLSCAIGFENLLLKGVSDSSYKFRLQLRPSILLKDIVFENSEEIRNFFSNLYFARGEIVHSDRDLEEIMGDDEFKTGANNYGPGEFANDVQYFLGQTIRTYMLINAEMGTSVQELNEQIEDAAFSAKLDVNIPHWASF